MVELSVIRDLVAIASFIIALTYYAFNIRHSIQNRKSQLYNQITSITMQKDWQMDAMKLLNMEWNDFDDFARKYDHGINPENYSIRSMQFGVMDSVGYYVKTGQVDLELASSLFGGFYHVWIWLKFKDVILRYRELLDLPMYYENLEYLAEKIIEYNEKKGTPISYPGDNGRVVPQTEG